jgi:hypothetical protein
MNETIRTENSDSNEKIPDLLRNWPIQRLRFDRAGRLKENTKKWQRKPLDVDLDKTIARLCQGIEELKSGRPVSQGLVDRARELGQSWHSELGKSTNLLLVFLAALVVAQKRHIERLVELGRSFDWPQPPQKLTSKQQYDLERRDVPVVGDIEREFGGVRPPGTRDMYDRLEESTCLDAILGGHAVHMQRLVQLFGRDRHLLSKMATVPIKKSRQTLYDYRTVTAIMDALLSEKQRKRRSSTRRRPRREPWLIDPPPAPDWRPVNAFWDVRHYCRSLRGIVREPLRSRVLAGIEQRINSLSGAVPEQIKSAFLVVIRHYIGDSGKK